jgi:xylono-1,5-lactonase
MDTQSNSAGPAQRTANAVSPHVVASPGNVLGEGPLWCAREQALWWLDVGEPSLFRWDLAGSGLRSWPLPKLPASLALMNEGGLLIAFRARFAVLSRPDQALRWLPVPDLSSSEERFNDGKVDRRGRFWVGTIDRALNRPLGGLHCFDVGGLRAVDSGFALSNGMGWSPDERTLYFAETHERRIYRYDFDPLAGTATNRQVFVDVPHGVGEPDGLTVDSTGGVWCALFGGSRINRYLPDGTLDRTIALPVSRPTSCAFGGPEMRTLFVTTARFGLDGEQLAAEPHAGSVLAVDVPETGLVEPRIAPDIVTFSETHAALQRRHT